MKERIFGGISANMLRFIAVVLMLSDHIWATFMSFGDWMTYIGRLAFPIFAFQIVEGFVHTSNLKKYILRLLVFALITEIPFNLFCSSSWFYPYHQNVLFTLLLGLLAIAVIDKARNSEDKKSKASVLWLLLIGVVSIIGFTDYGFLGVLTVVMFYLVRGYKFTWLLQLVGMVVIHVFLFEGQNIIFEVFNHTIEFPIQGFAVFALVPIWLYKGKRGCTSKALQYGFYAFYPVHMLVLYLIKFFA
jgi:hypothetical protein